MFFRRILIVLLTGVLFLLPAARIRAESPFEEAGYGSKNHFLNVARLQTGAGARQRVDLTAFLPPVGNQGKQQSCIGWAVGYACRTSIHAQAKHLRPKTASQIFSPAFLYNQINHHADNGGQVVDALKLLRSRGCATLATMPYDEDNFTRRPSAAACREAARYRIASWKSLTTGGQIRHELEHGHVVVLVIRTDSVFKGGHFTRYVPGSRVGVKPTGDAPRVDQAETGGETTKHALCVVGYDDRQKAFLLMNSWGKEWGLRGYCWVPYSSLNKIVNGSREFGQEAYRLILPRPVGDSSE